MSKFSPLGSCQRQFLKKVESLAPAMIPRGFLNQLGFAMWTPTTRQKHSRTVTRYQTDLTDAEWRVIAPHLPKPCATGRPREWPMREIVNGIFYVMRAGCPWRLVPSDLPPWGTIYRWFAAWRDDGRFERINHALVMADRERVGRDASPSAAIIDSQSVKTTEAGGPRGYDAGKKVNGRKRHALVDTDGRGLVIEAHPASVQDRDGGGPLLSLSRRSFPFIERVFADAGYAGERVAGATSVALEIVRKAPDQIGFAVQPRRWVVERFFAWIGRNRRLAKDFEATIASARAFLYAASVMLLVRRLARSA
jgi:putative transposase